MAGVVSGKVIRHDESFTLSRYLTVGDWSPSVYYVYRSCDEAWRSVERLM